MENNLLQQMILATPTGSYRNKLTVINLLFIALQEHDKYVFEKLLSCIDTDIHSCTICDDIGKHTTKEHQVNLDTNPPTSVERQNIQLKEYLNTILDAIADQPEGIFNSPEFYDMPGHIRLVKCINRLKKETGSVWKDAQGCQTTNERIDRFNKGK